MPSPLFGLPYSEIGEFVMSLSQFDRWLRERGIEKRGACYLLPCQGEAAAGASADASKEVPSAQAELTVTISTRTRDCHGDILEPTGVHLKRFLRNPIVLWAHDYSSLPIGRATALTTEGDGIRARILFAQTRFAHEVCQLYKDGFLRGWSVGFVPRKWDVLTDENRKFAGYHIKEWELLELSAVPVPANPEALTVALDKGRVREPMLVKSLRAASVPRKDSAEAVLPLSAARKDPEDAEWDAAAEVSQASIEDLKAMCAWHDPAHATAKSAHKLPHHRAKGHNVVWRGVSAAMGALLGARGGLDIPVRDRRGVYLHLAEHYEQFGKEPPAPDKAASPGRAASSNKEEHEAVSYQAECLARLKAIQAGLADAIGLFSKPSGGGARAASPAPATADERMARATSSEVPGDGRGTSPGLLAAALAPALRRELARRVTREIRRRQGKLD